MIRIIVSFWMFVSFFNILFFITSIVGALREVNYGLYELQGKIDEITKDKGAIEIPLVGVSWIKTSPYLFCSICPIWHLAFFYTFITKKDKIYNIFYNTFQGIAVKNVGKVMEEMGMKDVDEKEEEHDDVL